MPIFIAPEANGSRLVHKMGCPEMPAPSDCIETADTDDAGKALRNAKSQVRSDDEKVQLCPSCWRRPPLNLSVSRH